MRAGLFTLDMAGVRAALAVIPMEMSTPGTDGAVPKLEAIRMEASIPEQGGERLLLGVTAMVVFTLEQDGLAKRKLALIQAQKEEQRQQRCFSL